MTSAEEGIGLGWEVEVTRLAWRSRCEDSTVHNLLIVINALVQWGGPAATAGLCGHIHLAGPKEIDL